MERKLAQAAPWKPDWGPEGGTFEARAGCPADCWACSSPGRRPWRTRWAVLFYRRAAFLFRFAFDAVARVRSLFLRRCQALETSDEYLAAHIRHHGKVRWWHGYHRVFNLVSHFHPTKPPNTLKILSIGPRTEIEFYYLWLFFGFSWKNIWGADLVSTNPQILCADMSRKLPFEDSSFDVIVACHALEKSRDPQRTRDEIRRVAKPGAKVLVGGDRKVRDPRTPIPVIFFEEGAHSFVDLYGLNLQQIEYFDARSPHGYEIIFRVAK